MPATVLEPRFVDLRPACDRHGILGWPKRDVVLASHWPVFPRGRLRLLGEDYEVQCAIDVQMLSDFQGPDRFRNRIDGLTPALPRFAALHVLMTGETSLQDRAISPYAVIELHYRDGSRARLSAFYRRDVLPWWAQAFRPPEQTGLTRAHWVEAMVQAHASIGDVDAAAPHHYVSDPRASLFHIT
jgi:hypothetical protein